MSKLDSPYKCNYCGKIKPKTNHWFVVPGAQFKIHAPGQLANLTGFFLLNWDEDEAASPGAEHICPDAACAQKAMAKFLEKQP